MNPAPPVTKSFIRRYRLQALSKAIGVGCDRPQIVPVPGLSELVAERGELVEVDVALAERDLLEAGDLQSLAVDECLQEGARLEQRIVRARVEPRRAAAELHQIELPALEIHAVDVGDLQLAARRTRQVR